MKIIEPLKQDKKLVEYLTDEVKKVGIVFFHGLGDCVQFLNIYSSLRLEYTNIKFDILLQKGLDQQAIFPDGIELDSLDKIKEMTDYDYIFLVHFPVEQDPNLTKTELCCKMEIGTDWKFDSYVKISGFMMPVIGTKLVGIHYQNTALPDVFNPDKEIAEKIWNEVLDIGCIPIELDFAHPYHNPINKKFDFIDCTVRRVKPTVNTLIELMGLCKGIIAVPSGPLHCALSLMPSKVLYLEKSVPINRFIKTLIPNININKDKFEEGKVKEWLNILI